MSSILITGASGNVGSEIAKQLTLNNVPFLVTTHRPQEANAQKIYFDIKKPETFLPAFAGIDKLFLIRPPEISDAKKYFLPLVQAAQQQGIQHIVFLSVLGVENIKFVPHAKIEQYIQEAHIPYTFLRPSFFIQNVVNQHGDELHKVNTIYVPAGNGKTSFIDVRDIGEVGVKCLIQDGHQNRAYTLTGSEALTYYDVARIFSEETGRTITYAHPSLWQFRRHELAKGVPSAYVTVMTVIYLTTLLGFAKKVSQELALLLGRSSRTVRDYAQDFREQL
jgi:uncharacterized protein YbjT (DUF2867 family)